MRLKFVYISEYKNLKDFTLSFDGDSFLDIFVGKNGTGKSNLFEAVTEIFRHIFESQNRGRDFSFPYKIAYEIEGEEVAIEWKEGSFTINGQSRKTIGATRLPDNVLIYYSGHNENISQIIDRYKSTFQRGIQHATDEESRRFIGIGSNYKDLLLGVLLMQPQDNIAAKFIKAKLGVETIGETASLELTRPYFIDKKSEIDPIDPESQFWGASGITRQFLDKVVTCIKGGFTVGELYDRAADVYRIPINIERFHSVFSDEQSPDIFRKFDNLKTLEMFGKLSIEVRLINGLDANISHFSDGQFQSIYIYSLIELFKDRNCITLLDEPDSFLHPEWQYEFLKQVFEITDQVASKNHVLMTSHSAVTLIPHGDKKIKFFDVKDNHANCYALEKRVAIKKLSSDLIKYSEQEQILSIINAIQIENKPVLFTEGSTDPIIIKEAWNKLSDDEMPFIPFYAFSCTYITQLLTDNRIHAEMGGLPIFALFDFDRAYDQWNGMNGDVVVNNLTDGMVKKWAGGESYALMMPIPEIPRIKQQVIKNEQTGEHFGGESKCEIEHLFYGQAGCDEYFREEPCVGGSLIVFNGDGSKTKFAKEIVPTLPKQCFEVFVPLFDFIRSKCR